MKLCPADINEKIQVFRLGFFGLPRGILSPSLCSVREMSKQSTGLFLCRSFPRFARSSLPFLVQIPLGVKIKKIPHKSVLSFLACPEGFEPPFFRIGICCVIQLRHGQKLKKHFLRSALGSGIGIRTPTNRVRVCRATVTQSR